MLQVPRRRPFHFAGACKPDANEDIMPAYWIARSKINDPIEYKKYTGMVMSSHMLRATLRRRADGDRRI